MQTQRSLDEFRNEPFTDYSTPENTEAMKTAIAKVRSQLGREYPMVINGEKVTLKDKVDSINPANKGQIVGVFSEGDTDISLVDKAIDAATAAFKIWRNVPYTERAEYLFKIADIMRQRKHELSAWMVFEVAKTWAEADGDTAEAIDFCEFYGREMLKWGDKQPVVPYPGEDNRFEYIPLGVGAIIPPWNFPLAIMAGMSMAAVVAGNTVVLKPSSDSPTIAAKFMEIVEEAGIPAGVVNFLTGSAATGEAMVTSPKTRFISFTGSKQVGLHINEEAAKAREGQIWIKRVVAEMGGKDAIVVADDADLDSAASGTVAAAFGFQGQKCSACSRLIVDEKVHDELMEKIVALTEKLKIGQPTEGDTNVAAVINQKSYNNTLGYIQKGIEEGGTVLTGGKGNDTEGFYIEPTIIDNVAPGATIEQEEIFAPVLAVIKARDFDHALEIANDTEFGLTGAVYSTSQENLERARREFHVGNLYLNRKCTGALVGVHPFGGFNMSGTDSKAGEIDRTKNLRLTNSFTMKIMSIKRGGILLLISMFAVSLAAAQKPRPKPKPPVKPKPIIFAVDNDGKMIEPIAYIDKGKLTDATNSVAGQKSFATTFYKKGTNYTLVFGGANDGKFAVTKSNVGSDCAGNRADGTVTAGKAKLKGIVMALATNAKVVAGPGVRRLPTAAERAEVEALVKAEFTKQNVSAAMQKDLRYQNLTAIDVNKDGKAELVGSYWLGPNDKDRRLLFFVADRGASGKYSFGYSEYQHVTPDKVMSGEVKDLDDGIYHELLLDSLDIDGDGTNEIFTMIAAFEGNNFHVFRRQGGKWVKSFEAYNYHCAY